MDNLKEYSKHCCVSLEGIKRRFDDKDFGGKPEAIEAADRTENDDPLSSIVQETRGEEAMD